MSQGSDWWQGSLYGVFRTIGKGSKEDIHFAIPFDMTILLKGRGRNLKGTYHLQAWPFVVKPRRKKMLPGFLDFFPDGGKIIKSIEKDFGQVLTNAITEEKYTFGPPIKDGDFYAEGDVEVIFKQEKMILKFKNMPQGFTLKGSIEIDIEFIRSLGDDPQKRTICKDPERWIDLGFFSKKASFYLKQLEMKYNHRMLRYDTTIEENRKCCKYPIGGKDYYSARAEMVHVQTWYHTDQTDFVEDVDTTEIREYFLSHPGFAEKMKQEAEKNIAEGLHENLYSKKLVDMLDSLTGDVPPVQETPTSLTASIGSRFPIPDSTGEPPLKGTPREGIELALRYLMEFSKGANYLMIAIDGCWVKFQFRKSKNELHLQVAGNKYIPKSRNLSANDINLLADMGIILQDGYIDLYTANFDDPNFEDITDFVDLAYKVYSAVYRMNKGEEAYMAIDLGTKTPEGIDAVNSLVGFFPKRKEEIKFYWNWEIEPETEPAVGEIGVTKIITKKGISNALNLLATTGGSDNKMELNVDDFSVQLAGQPDDDFIHCSFETNELTVEQVTFVKNLGFDGGPLYKLDFDVSSGKIAIRNLGTKLLDLFNIGFGLDSGTKGSLTLKLLPESKATKRGLKKLGKILPDNDGETFYWVL